MTSGTSHTWVRAAAHRLMAMRGDPARLKRVFERSLVPMLIVDGQRRYIEANAATRLAFRLSVGQLRRLRIDDLTPSKLLGVMEEAWARLIETGCVGGPYEVALPDASRLAVTYHALAGALPDLHLIAFAPAGWSHGELVGGFPELDPEALSALTPRELEVLELAAEGLTGPMIARELVVSAATVRTHFEHIYAKLGVSDRAGAVAKAMRLGLIC
jgi:DNA-binding CsgD family transcriptional regulator